MSRHQRWPPTIFHKCVRAAIHVQLLFRFAFRRPRLYLGIAAFLPRDVNIWVQAFGALIYATDNEDRSEVFRYITTQAPPAMLHVNKESREIGLKYYCLAFDSAYSIPGRYDLRMTTPSKIFVNLRYDRICLFANFGLLSFPRLLDPRPAEHKEQNVQQHTNNPLRIAINVVSAFLYFMISEDEIYRGVNPIRRSFAVLRRRGRVSPATETWTACLNRVHPTRH